ncbi:hypothetical protein D3C80_2105530 [compost metagenome]
MVLPMASQMGRSLGFQAWASILLSNQNQPITLKPATGTITPQTVRAPILPVMFGPPKLARMVSQIRPAVPTNRVVALLPSQGKNAVM